MRKIVRVKNKLRAEKRLHKLQLEQARDKRRALKEQAVEQA